MTTGYYAEIAPWIRPISAMVVKSLGLGVWVQILVLPCFKYVQLGKSFQLLKPQPSQLIP